MIQGVNFRESTYCLREMIQIDFYVGKFWIAISTPWVTVDDEEIPSL